MCYVFNVLFMIVTFHAHQNKADNVENKEVTKKK